MKFITVAIIWIFLIARAAIAHEMTPTYPVLRPSYMDGLSTTKLTLFNKRNDAIHYEIQVFDKYWKQIPFASQEKIIRVDYLAKKNFEVYIRNSDKNDVEYICTMSKLPKTKNSSSMIASKICSKIERD
jgi:hypothetical protein